MLAPMRSSAPSAASRASSIPTSRTCQTLSIASAKSSRPMRSCPTRNGASSTTGSVTPVCAAAVFSPRASISATSPTFSRPSSVTISSVSGVAPVAGAEPDTPVRSCPTCGGTGRLRQVSRSVFGEFVRTGTCPTCTGSGKLVEQPCEQCHGSGRVIEERTLEVEIPAGIHDGQRIRLSGEGHAGSVGARAGDVYVEVHVRPDQRFVREGNDVYTTVDLTITQAALGATVTVPTLEGETELSFEPGTQPGEIVVLRGRGLPVLQGFGRGNQRVLDKLKSAFR